MSAASTLTISAMSSAASAKKGGKKAAKKAESVTKMAAANAKLWEARLEMTERSRMEYRENARKLILENESLQGQVHQTEKDTIDVITYLKRQDQEKDNTIERLQAQIKDLKKEGKKEKEQIVEDFSSRVNQLEEKLAQKTNEVQLMQSELKLVKEFRKKRGQMQRELDEIKEAMFLANKEHKDTLTRMEQKFFEEKMRLQQEANQKIAELAERAHTEAIANLDETTRSVYKENVRVTEALNYHIEESSKLKKVKDKLEEENDCLSGDKELNELMIQDKVVQSKQQKMIIHELQEKVLTLEKSLSHVVREFETESKCLVERCRVETESSKIEISKLQRIIELKTKEMNKVKRLAKNILDQRTELERFFIESLEHVKMEIAANQVQYRKDAQAAYYGKMLDAHSGKGNYPKIRTFNKSDFSTNSVFRDLEAAEKLINISGKIDISELTWEQKERVLRHLFAKMNGHSKSKKSDGLTSLPAIHQGQTTMLSITTKSEDGAVESDNTFLTQAHVDGADSLPSHGLQAVS